MSVMSLSNITKTKKQRQVLTCLFVDRVVICETSAADLTTPTISENDTIFVQFFTVQSETENGGLYFLEYCYHLQVLFFMFSKLSKLSRVYH